MRNLTPGEADRLRALTIDFILEARAEHLAGPKRDQLGHWDLILNRMKSAALRSDSVQKWVSEVLSEICVGAPKRHLAASMLALSDEVATTGTIREWRRLVRTEAPLIIARARAIADQRKADREERLAAEENARAVADFEAWKRESAPQAPST